MWNGPLGVDGPTLRLFDHWLYTRSILDPSEAVLEKLAGLAAEYDIESKRYRTRAACVCECVYLSLTYEVIRCV